MMDHARLTMPSRLVIVCLLAALAVRGNPVQAQGRQGTDPAAPFATAWEQLLNGGAGWQMAVSPAFPEQWPPDNQVPVRYAYAYRLPQRIADGAEMSVLWARSTGNPSGVELLRRDLASAGIQGVRPMEQDEARLATRQEEVAALLSRPLSHDEEGLVRAFYCNWRRRLGVVAAQVEPRHPAFFRWLGCR